MATVGLESMSFLIKNSLNKVRITILCYVSNHLPCTSFRKYIFLGNIRHMKMITNCTAVTWKAGVMNHQLCVSQENFENSEKHKKKLKIRNNQIRENIHFFYLL